MANTPWGPHGAWVTASPRPAWPDTSSRHRARDARGSSARAVHRSRVLTRRWDTRSPGSFWRSRSQWAAQCLWGLHAHSHKTALPQRSTSQWQPAKQRVPRWHTWHSTRANLGRREVRWDGTARAGSAWNTRLWGKEGARWEERSRLKGKTEMLSCDAGEASPAASPRALSRQAGSHPSMLRDRGWWQWGVPGHKVWGGWGAEVSPSCRPTRNKMKIQADVA